MDEATDTAPPAQLEQTKLAVVLETSAETPDPASRETRIEESKSGWMWPSPLRGLTVTLPLPFV